MSKMVKVYIPRGNIGMWDISYLIAMADGLRWFEREYEILRL